MKTVFDLHPNLKSYHQTSDGTKFFKAYDAKAHAQNLEDKTINCIARPVKSAKKKSLKAN